MHIEPGIVDGAKMALAWGTAAGAAGYTAVLARRVLAADGAGALAGRTALAALGTLVCFEVLPHFTAGVSEVHFILGTTLFLVLGAAPAAIGLALGLLLQGAFFAPSDMGMYFVNVTTLLVPLFVVDALARRTIPAATAYVDLSYGQVARLSAAFQGGIVAWVAFWVIYGQGAGAETLASLGAFAASYAVVLLVEPLVDLAALAAAKGMRGPRLARALAPRLYGAA